MSTKPEFYPAAQIDPILSDTLDNMEKLAQTCLNLEKEKSELLAKLAELEAGVVLEKVASEVRFEPEQLKNFTEKLASHGLIAPGFDTVDIAESLQSDPQAILKLASRVVTLLASAPSTGGGVERTGADAFIEKAASIDPTFVEDGWLDLARLSS